VIGVVVGNSSTPNCQQLTTTSHWTHRTLRVSAVSFLVDVGRKITELTGEPLEVQFLFQRISVLV